MHLSFDKSLKRHLWEIERSVSTEMFHRMETPNVET